MTTTIGTIDAIMRFPVKSLLGETLDQCPVDAGGLSGDRGYALLDVASGKIASAKQPNLWRELLSLGARTEPSGGPMRVVISGASAESRHHLDPGLDAWLSRFIGREVKLIEVRPKDAELNRARPDEVLDEGLDGVVTQDLLVIAAAAPEGGFFDFAPIHLMNTASLDAIRAAAPDATIEAQRYRPNLVIDAHSSAPFAENQWVGRRLLIGQSLELEIIAPTPRCAVPMLAHGDLPHAPDAVRAVNKLNRVEFPLLGEGRFPCLGAYATVVTAGLVRQGDQVRLD